MLGGIARTPPPRKSKDAANLALSGGKKDGDGGRLGAQPPQPPPTAAPPQAPQAPTAPVGAGTAPKPGPVETPEAKFRREREEKLRQPAAMAKLKNLAMDRQADSVENLITVGLNNPSKSTLATLMDGKSDLSLCVNEFEKAISDICLIDVPDKLEEYSKKCDKATRIPKQVFHRANETCALIEKVLDDEETKRATALAREGRSNPAPVKTVSFVDGGSDPKTLSVRPYKPNDSLKPKILTRDNTPVEFSMWSLRFKAYYTSSHMEILTLNEQQAYFYACIEPQLVSRIERKVTNATPVFTEFAKPPGTVDKSKDGSSGGSVARPKSCMDYLSEEYIQIYPYYNRRLNYQKTSRPQGQSTSDWIQDMLRERDECNFATQTDDEAFVHRILTGLNDQALSKELMKRRELTISQLIAEVGLWESNKKCLQSTYSQKSAGATANVVSVKRANNKPTGSGNKQGSSQAQGKTNTQHNAPVQAGKKSDFQCYRCGQRDKDHNCKARDATCRNCTKVGHYAGMCKSKLRAKVFAAQTKDAEAVTNATVTK